MSMGYTKAVNDHTYSVSLKLAQHLSTYSLSNDHHMRRQLIRNICEMVDMLLGDYHAFAQSCWPPSHEAHCLIVCVYHTCWRTSSYYVTENTVTIMESL